MHKLCNIMNMSDTYVSMELKTKRIEMKWNETNSNEKEQFNLYAWVSPSSILINWTEIEHTHLVCLIHAKKRYLA